MLNALKAGFLGAAMIVGASMAHAATLVPNGVVMVNTGNGFVQVTGPTQVAPGDMVMVNNGSAQMSFPDGSTTPMEPGQVYTVGNVGSVPPNTGGGGGGGGGGAGGTGGLSTTTLVVGGVVVAGGVAAAVAASGGSSSKKTSP